MARDVNEQVFNEKQFFIEDVVGEDENPPGLLSPPGPSGADAPADSRQCLLPALEQEAVPSQGSPTVVVSGGAAVAGADGARPPAAASAGALAREKRRKRTAERAQKIIFWLETKYDVLLSVCLSFENWKESPSSTYDFDLLWCDTAIPADRFMKLKPYQKMNHFVGMSSITRKNNLGRNLLRMRKQFPKEYRFFPDTWILPTDLSDFKTQFSSSKNKTFIIKPDNGCQGKGIFLVRDVEKVPVDFSATYVAQRYVHRPFLLDGFKFDLRLYVLVLGCDPLRIFLHRRGLVRLATEQYSEPTGKNLQQCMVHLTNYAINKMNPNFEENTDPDDAQDGHKRSWEAVQEHLRRAGHDVDSLLGEIEDLIVKTLIAVQPSLSHFYHSCQPEDLENAMCFEILGFDVILDHKLQPWLLEVNHAPSFATESDLDRVVKTEVLEDTLGLLNMCPEARRIKKREAREKMELRAMGQSKKQSMEERMGIEQGIARERTEWEDAHLGSYKRLYPSETKEREYMHLHDAAINIWEMLMGGTSRRSVRLTQAIPDEEETKEAERKAAAEKARKLGAEGKEQQKRTPEQLRQVVERLMNGCPAMPRSSVASTRRRGSKGASEASAEQAPHPDDEEQCLAAGAAADGEDAEEAPTTKSSSGSRSGAPRPDVQVGDIIKVQTNLGWESVAVRAKRTNGKIDIQFKDGEYMRCVLPRILREPSSGAAAAAEAPPPAEVQAAAAAVASAAAAASVPPLAPPQPFGHPLGHAGPALQAQKSARGSSSVPPSVGASNGVDHRPHLLPVGFTAAGGPLSPVPPFLHASGAVPAPGALAPVAGDGLVPLAHEALASLDAQLSAQLRVRRGRSSQPPDLGAPIPGGLPLRGANRASSHAGHLSSATAIPLSVAEQNRVYDARLRSQLQQFICVRPIVTRSPGVDPAAVGLTT